VSSNRPAARALFTNERVSKRLLGTCEEQERGGGELSQPGKAFVAHEILLRGLRDDIEIKLQTMDLCRGCERGLGRPGIDLDAVRGVCEAVRDLARAAPPPRGRPATEHRSGL
jgi:hypothetical protein